MKLNLGAIDADSFKRIYLPMPNSVARQPAAAQAIVADQILGQCLSTCGKATIKTSYLFPSKSIFEAGHYIDPQFHMLKECEAFIHALVKPPTMDSYPWWLKLVSRPTSLLKGEQLARFSHLLHDSKFVEVFSQQSTNGLQAKSGIELCLFLDESVRRNCWVLCQVEDPNMN